MKKEKVRDALAVKGMHIFCHPAHKGQFVSSVIP